jgi:hypothetical protein
MHLALPFDRAQRASEPLAALLSDERSSAYRIVEMRLGKDAITADAPAKPRGKRLLVRKAGGIHRSEFRREQLRVVAPYPEYDQRSRIPYNCRPYRV